MNKEENRYCRKCLIVKPSTDFYPRKAGYTSHCKECIRENIRRKYRNMSDEEKEKYIIRVVDNEKERLSMDGALEKYKEYRKEYMKNWSLNKNTHLL